MGRSCDRGGQTGVSTWRPSEVPPSERDPKRLSDSLDRITRHLGGPSADVFSTVFVRWEDLVGPDIAAHSRPVSLRDGVLVLAVDQTAWAAQLRFLSAELLERISAAAGARQVSDISIRVVAGFPPADRRR